MLHIRDEDQTVLDESWNIFIDSLEHYSDADERFAVIARVSSSQTVTALNDALPSMGNDVYMSMKLNIFLRNLKNQ